MAPIPGETKVWQYITLMKRIYLIDCPGVVPPNQSDSEEDILLRGVVRVENVENPAQYIPAVLRRTQTRHLERTYEIKQSEYNDDPHEFLNVLARKGGRLLKGGEADVDGVAKMVLNDFLRGKIPWFTPLQKQQDGTEKPAEEDEVVAGRRGRLGEMPAPKSTADGSQVASTADLEDIVPESASVEEDVESESSSIEGDLVSSVADGESDEEDATEGGVST